MKEIVRQRAAIILVYVDPITLAGTARTSSTNALEYDALIMRHVSTWRMGLFVTAQPGSLGGYVKLINVDVPRLHA